MHKASSINIKFDTMKVVIAGASGSGKTTLAKALAEHYGWHFKENSAGLIMGNINKAVLEATHGYSGDWGQRKVINYSHGFPEFGRNFQQFIFEARKRLIEYPGNAIYDRSSLDPIVFYLNQVVHNDMQDDSEHFIHQCITGLRKVDLILRIPLQNPERCIEDNNSRVANYWFQRKIDTLFDLAIQLVLEENQRNPYLLDNHMIRIAHSPTWDWQERFNWAVGKIDQLVAGIL